MTTYHKIKFPEIKSIILKNMIRTIENNKIIIKGIEVDNSGNEISSKKFEQRKHIMFANIKDDIKITTMRINRHYDILVNA